MSGPSRISSGRFLSVGAAGAGEAPSDARPEIVLGAALARDLAAEVGDELLLYGVAYTLEMAYELFSVVGITSRQPMRRSATCTVSPTPNPAHENSSA